MTPADGTSTSASGDRVADRSSQRARLALLFRIVYLRLRFFLVLGAIFLVLAGWGSLTNLWDWTMMRLGREPNRTPGVSPDTEYFCPMCPGVVSNWPQKCAVCKMPLVRRHKGDAALLPEGVVARMQISPYRLQLAGIRTGPVRYESLSHIWSSLGRVEVDPQRVTAIVAPVAGRIKTIHGDKLWQHVDAGESLLILDPLERRPDSSDQELELRAPSAGHVTRIVVRPGQTVATGEVLAEVVNLDQVYLACELPREDLAFVQVGQGIEIERPDHPAAAKLRGLVAAIQPVVEVSHGPIGVRIVVETSGQAIVPGTMAKVTGKTLLADVEPYRSMPRNAPAVTTTDLREIYVCDDHPGFVYTRAGKCPFHDVALQTRPLLDNQRVQWTCPAHGDVHAHEAGNCAACEGLPRIPTVVTYSPPDQVLTVPDSALIDTGDRQIVFVESAPGMFDAVPVRVGARCGDAVPVLEGLEAGQLVAMSGAFLLDAETRLNPGVAASYFGAGSRLTATDDRDSVLTGTTTRASQDRRKLDLPPGDLARVRQQKICPITKLALGSMGKPIRVRVGEQVVYLCCEACTGKVRGGTADSGTGDSGTGDSGTGDSGTAQP